MTTIETPRMARAIDFACAEAAHYNKESVIPLRNDYENMRLKDRSEAEIVEAVLQVPIIIARGESLQRQLVEELKALLFRR